MNELGFTVVLSPGQFAAALSGGTLDGGPDGWTRFWGGTKLLFGGIEALGAGALLLAPEPTMLTKVGGAALGAHGCDTMQSGSRQLWTGHETTTLTSEGTAALAAALGVDEATAGKIGEGIDLAVPVTLTFGLGAARVATIRSGRIVLAEHEAAALRGVGGHTIARHIGQTDAQLLARLGSNTRITAASTFASVREAEAAVTSVFQANTVAISAWARTAAPNARQAFSTVAGSGGVGRVMVRSATMSVPGRTIRRVLKKEVYQGKLYYILTAFPEL